MHCSAVGDLGEDWMDTGLYSPLLTPVTIITPLANNNGFATKTVGKDVTQNTENFGFGHLVTLKRYKTLPARRWSL